jgi:ABC-type bacteriocin/lantibiotic exporter with double-glycine peptidase domain
MIKTPWKRLSELLKLEKVEVSQLYIYALFSGLLGLSLPLGIQSIINFIQAGQISTSWLMLILFVTGGVILSGTLQIMQLRITENLQQKIFTRYSFDLAYRFPRFRRNALDENEPVELINRFFDIITLQKGIAKVLLDFTSSSLQVAFSLIVLSFYHPFYIAFSILLVFTLYLVFRPMIKSGFQTSMKESSNKYKTAYWMQQIARADWSFRLTPKGNLPLKRLDEHTQDYLASREDHFKILWKQYIWMISIKAIIVAALLGLGGYLVIDQQMNLGQFVAAEVLILLLLASVEKLIQLLETLYDVFTSLEKLGQLSDLPLAFEEDEKTENHNIPEISIFPMELIKKDSNSTRIISIEKYDKTILKGQNPIELTFIMRQLIDRTIDSENSLLWNKSIPDANSILSTFNVTGWYEKGTQLINGSLMENLKMGRDNISEQQLKTSIKTVGLDNFIEDTIDGYDLKISSQYGQFPESIKERLLIARSIIHEPELLLLSLNDLTLNEDEIINILQNIEMNYPQTTIVCATNTIELPNWKIKYITNETL